MKDKIMLYIRNKNVAERFIAFTQSWHDAGEMTIGDVMGADELDNAFTAIHFYNFLLWHEEDQARRRDVGDSVIASVKQRIDRLNQLRNDAIEVLDEQILSSAQEEAVLNTNAVLHSETAGSIVDRISIGALKLYHMREQAARTDKDEDFLAVVGARAAVLEEQISDMQTCYRNLLDAIIAGKQYFKVYRQFKMYNDPETNPAVYGNQKKGA